jgi:hypothetical protein
MPLQFGALRDALIEAGAGEAKAKAASEEVAAYMTRGRGFDGTQMLALWVVGLLLAAIVVSQLALWAAMGRLSGRLQGVSSQISEIERLVRQLPRQGGG